MCRPPSISLSFNLATVLPRRHAYRVSFATRGVDSSYSKRAPFRARTTRVSNPVCSPSFRASVSGVVQGLAFATGVPLDIYAFHCYTKNSSPPSNPPVQAVFNAIPGLSPGLSHQTCQTTCAPFTPSESEQRSGPLYYRGCWHRVSRPFLFRYNQLDRYSQPRFVRK